MCTFAPAGLREAGLFLGQLSPVASLRLAVFGSPPALAALLLVQQLVFLRYLVRPAGSPLALPALAFGGAHWGQHPLGQEGHGVQTSYVDGMGLMHYPVT